MAIHPHFLLPISRRIVAIATTHGGSNRFRTMKEKAPIVVNIPAIPALTAASPAPAATPFRTPSVPTACSLAISAEMTATAPFQSPKPRGAKNHFTALPIEASMLLSISDICIVQLKFDRNQMATQAVKMIVPALMMKALALSHIWIRTPLREGTW